MEKIIENTNNVLNCGGVAASHVEIIEIYHDNSIGVSLKNNVV